ncbi:hypothetical protein PPL_08087 [Heterostelium album PN500]|uniref:Uncharacterized protein n=1 Tax=Heterostelium pallidum (strain ATCC 26659 / Pp 5 / PN500) TaxID=670386 RepID=D3BIK8_HETP5|nr:hypothetical protein PPL_08087 [Heterostelium album PN500]EFA78632.1 hypothetical protein PPL_08087 [Heterostelium album PN500]|eukprot:XP_020430756.1 hypothetical protein PPL_08087 [Heterostelium album PN500]
MNNNNNNIIEILNNIDYFKSQQINENCKENELIINISKWLYEHNKENILQPYYVENKDVIQLVLSNLLRDYTSESNSGLFKDLYQDSGIIGHLKSFCNIDDLCSVLLENLFCQRNYKYFVHDTELYKQLDLLFNIVSIAPHLVNRDSKILSSKSRAMLILIHLQRDNLSNDYLKLTSHHQSILDYIVFSSETFDSNMFIDYFKLFNKYFEVKNGNVDLVKLFLDRLNNKDDKMILDRSLFSRFIDDDEWNILSLSKIDLDARIEYCKSLSTTQLQSEQIVSQLVKSIDMSNLESLAVLYCYVVNKINLPTAILSYIENNFYYFQPAEEAFNDIRLQYQTQIVQCLCLIPLLFKNQFLAKHSIEPTFSNRISFWKAIAPALPLDQCEYILKKIDNIQGPLLVELVDFIMLTKFKKELVVHIANSGYTMELGLKRLYSVDNIEFLGIVLNYQFTECFTIELMHYNVQIIERLAKEKPDSFKNIIQNVEHLPIFNIIPFLHECKSIHKYFNNNNVVETSTIQLPFVILKKILGMLIFDKYLETKWLIELSTVSKDIHQFCSNTISNLPITSIEILSEINIGHPYCLFKNPPLHIIDSQLIYIPEHQRQLCLDRLESLTQTFYFCNNNSNVYFKTIESNNLSHVTYREIRVDSITDKINRLYKIGDGRHNSFNIDGENHHNYRDPHFFKQFLDRQNNDKLQSITYIGYSDVDNSYDPLETAYVTVLPLLQRLHQSKLDLVIDVELPNYIPNLKFPKDLALITKLNYFHTNDLDQKQLEYPNLKSITLSDLTIGPLDVNKIIENALYITNLNLYCTVEELIEILELRTIHPRITKITLTFRVDDCLKSVNQRLQPDLLNSLFERLSMPEHQSIRQIKLQMEFTDDLAYKKAPIINSHNLKAIDLGSFKACSHSLKKFSR